MSRCIFNASEIEVQVSQSSQDPANTGATEPDQTKVSSILGVSTDALEQVSVAELCEDPVAIRMVLHYYRQLQNENSAQKSEINTLKVYVDAFKNKKQNSQIGGPMLLISNLVTGAAINILTSCATSANTNNPVLVGAGISLLIAGIGMAGFGGWLTTWKDN